MRSYLRKIDDPKILLIAALLVSAIGFAVLGNTKLNPVPVENGATTETAAAAERARIELIVPKLRIEPK